MNAIWKFTGWKAFAPPLIVMFLKYVGIFQLDWLLVLVGCLVWIGFAVGDNLMNAHYEKHPWQKPESTYVCDECGAKHTLDGFPMGLGHWCVDCQTRWDASVARYQANQGGDHGDR